MDIVFGMTVLAGLLLFLGLLSNMIRSLWKHNVGRTLRFGGFMFIALGLLSSVTFYHEWSNSLVLNGTGGWARLPEWFLVLPFIIGFILLFGRGAIMVSQAARKLWRERLNRAALAPAERAVSRDWRSRSRIAADGPGGFEHLND